MLTMLAGSMAYASGTYVAQVINIVGEGKVQDPYYLLLFSTANNGPFPGTSNEAPMAVVKDGLGEWKLTKDITVNDPLVVREGTFTIEGATVLNNTPLSNGVSNLSVGGKSAHLVLDNATYKQDLDYAKNYVSAIAIGNTDGKGTVTLKNNSVLHTDQFIFAGYEKVSAGYVTGTTTSQNDSTPYSNGEQGRSTINIESGSTLSAGTCFQFANVDVKIDGAGSKMVDLNRDSSPASANYSYFGTANNSETNISVTNGGALQLNQYVYAGYGNNSKTNIEVEGENSTMSVAKAAYLGYAGSEANGSSVSISLKDGATATFHGYVALGNNDAASISVENATLSLHDVMDMGTSASLSLDGNSTLALTIDELGADAIITLSEGAMLNIAEGAEIELTLSDAVLEAVMASRSTNNIEIVLFAGLDEDDSVDISNLTVKSASGDFSLDSTSVTVNEDGSVVVKSTASIPEPTTATLSLLALAALASRRRRK